MAKKKKSSETEITVEPKKKVASGAAMTDQSVPPAAVPKTPPPAAEIPVKAKVEKKSDLFKNLALAGLVVLAIALAYYFITSSETTFNPGSKTDQETFANTFEDTGRIFIVMDTRGVSDSQISDNILQCGVDFAGSTGMGGKNVTPIGIDSSSCTAPDGTHQTKECFSWLKSGLTIYVKEGSPPGADYYSNGMVVRLGREYAVGTCGIHAR